MARTNDGVEWSSSKEGESSQDNRDAAGTEVHEECCSQVHQLVEEQACCGPELQLDPSAGSSGGALQESSCCSAAMPSGAVEQQSSSSVAKGQGSGDGADMRLYFQNLFDGAFGDEGADASSEHEAAWLCEQELWREDPTFPSDDSRIGRRCERSETCSWDFSDHDDDDAAILTEIQGERYSGGVRARRSNSPDPPQYTRFGLRSRWLRPARNWARGIGFRPEAAPNPLVARPGSLFNYLRRLPRGANRALAAPESPESPDSAEPANHWGIIAQDRDTDGSSTWIGSEDSLLSLETLHGSWQTCTPEPAPLSTGGRLTGQADPFSDAAVEPVLPPDVDPPLVESTATFPGCASGDEQEQESLAEQSQVRDDTISSMDELPRDDSFWTEVAASETAGASSSDVWSSQAPEQFSMPSYSSQQSTTVGPSSEADAQDIVFQEPVVSPAFTGHQRESPTVPKGAKPDFVRRRRSDPSSSL